MELILSIVRCRQFFLLRFSIQEEKFGILGVAKWKNTLTSMVSVVSLNRSTSHAVLFVFGWVLKMKFFFWSITNIFLQKPLGPSRFFFLFFPPISLLPFKNHIPVLFVQFLMKHESWTLPGRPSLKTAHRYYSAALRSTFQDLDVPWHSSFLKAPRWERCTSRGLLGHHGPP